MRSPHIVLTFKGGVEYSLIPDSEGNPDPLLLARRCSIWRVNLHLVFFPSMYLVFAFTVVQPRKRGWLHGFSGLMRLGLRAGSHVVGGWGEN